MVIFNPKQTLLFLVFLLIASCNQEKTQLPSIPPDCTESSTIQSDKAADGLSFDVFLPPCYEHETNTRYPILIWTTSPLLIDTPAELLINNQEIHPLIIIKLFNSGGENYEQRLAEELVPYVDAHYRTIAERPFRAVAGISHGGAIAARSGWRYPDLFGQAITISGGIANNEKDKFTDWITAVSPEEYPNILIDVGTDDGIMPLTDDYRDVLNSQEVSYSFTTQPGGHTLTYWEDHIPDYLRWLDTIWQTQEK